VTTAPTPAPQAPPPAELAGEGNEAVVALLDSASDYVGTGELDKAAAALERALRIEPRNASIWHDLGQIRLHQGQYQQAESLATKSNSLAGDNNTLKARNWRLIAVSRQAVGDQIGADAAEAQAIVVER
jgi:tetratricopeptide (TPR) repeat protein